MSPGILREPVLRLNRFLGHSSAKNHMSKVHIGNTSVLKNNEYEEREIKKIQHQQVRQQRLSEEHQSLDEKRKAELDAARAADSPEIRARYGDATADILDSADAAAEAWSENIKHEIRAGSPLSFTARIHHIRSISPSIIFIVFRNVETIQGVLEVREGAVSEHFIRWARHLTAESIVFVQGSIEAPVEPVHGCTITDLEVRIDSLHLRVPVENPLPVDVYSIDRVEKDDEGEELGFAASNRVRTGNRVAFLRTPTAQSIFRIRSGICSIFRSTLEEHGFVEIHTPKLQPAATESGAEVFKARYFGRDAFLAQSPQLAKQSAISADFGRVYEIGPVFRAENSNTHRHLTEYTGMDLEMVIGQDYHESLDIIDELLKGIFRGVYDRFRDEVDMIKTHFPHEDLVWLDKTPRLTFKEGVELLNSSGWTDDQGRNASDNDDLSTRAEVRLGELVKEKFKTDFYILDKFPTSARPFYTQRDPKDAKVTNSFDIFLRGQEITTGGERINNPTLLKERMKEAGIDPDEMEEYLQGFEWGVLPHAGCGIGLERLLFLLLNLGDIRNATMFPRDPKSLPERKKADKALPHPEADTIRYAYRYEKQEKPELPPLEALIANYGDATNTSWLDDRYLVWRHEQTGAAVGYAEENGYALVMGDPLCAKQHLQPVIRAFLKDLQKVKDLRPLWLLVSDEVEEILGAKLGWHTLSCVAEERIPVDEAKDVSTIGKKKRQAGEAGVVIQELELGSKIPEDFRARCDKRIEDWKGGRTGKQVHITEIAPWVDYEHRRYIWAENKEGEVAALVVLHQLSPTNGFQIKMALDFPNSPPGSIESAISHAIQSLANSGIKTVTFGAGPLLQVRDIRNLDKIRSKILSHTYRTIIEQLKLVQKSEFRQKFGIQEDPLHICYPKLGLGISGVRTLIKFFEDEM